MPHRQPREFVVGAGRPERGDEDRRDTRSKAGFYQANLARKSKRKSSRVPSRPGRPPERKAYWRTPEPIRLSATRSWHSIGRIDAGARQVARPRNQTLGTQRTHKAQRHRRPYAYVRNGLPPKQARPASAMASSTEKKPASKGGMRLQQSQSQSPHPPAGFQGRFARLASAVNGDALDH